MCYFCGQRRNAAGFSLRTSVSLTNHYSTNAQPLSSRLIQYKPLRSLHHGNPTNPLIIIIIIIVFITLMQGIYNYIPETNHVSRVHSVASALYLQFVLHVMLFHIRNMFCTFTLALSAVCVQCPIWLLI